MSYSVVLNVGSMDNEVSITIRSREMIKFLELPYPKEGDGIHEEEPMYDAEAFRYISKAIPFLLERSKVTEVTLLSTILESALHTAELVEDAKRMHLEYHTDLSDFHPWHWCTLQVSVIN